MFKIDRCGKYNTALDINLVINCFCMCDPAKMTTLPDRKQSGGHYTRCEYRPCNLAPGLALTDETRQHEC